MASRARRLEATNRIFSKYKIDPLKSAEEITVNLLNMFESEATLALQKLLVETLRHYVEQRDQIRVEAFLPAEKILIMQVSVALEDQPKVIGEAGDGIRKLKTLFAMLGESLCLKVAVELKLAPKHLLPPRKPERDPDNNLYFEEAESIQHLLGSMLKLLCYGEDVKVTFKDSEGLTVFMATVAYPISPQVEPTLVALMNRMSKKYGRRLLLYITQKFEDR